MNGNESTPHTMKWQRSIGSVLPSAMICSLCTLDYQLRSPSTMPNLAIAVTAPSFGQNWVVFCCIFSLTLLFSGCLWMFMTSRWAYARNYFVIGQMLLKHHLLELTRPSSTEPTVVGDDELAQSPFDSMVLRDTKLREASASGRRKLQAVHSHMHTSLQ